jgi:hypothetical protein
MGAARTLEGEAGIMTGYAITDLPVTMQTKIAVNGECWIWTAAKNRKGYGCTASGTKNRTMLAHRRAYEATKGPIPEGLQIDHLCFTTSCVNPAHLEAVTGAENARRRATRYTRPYVVSEEAIAATRNFTQRILNRLDAMTPEQRADFEAGRARLHARLGCCQPASERP